jgi:hypothetical protein
VARTVGALAAVELGADRECNKKAKKQETKKSFFISLFFQWLLNFELWEIIQNTRALP